METIHDYLDGRPLTISRLRRFCRFAFSRLQETPAPDTTKIRLRFVMIPAGKLNGVCYALRGPRKTSYRIFVNLYPTLKDRELSQAMRLFNLYSVIAHELKHIQLERDMKQGTLSNYRLQLVGWKTFFLRRTWLSPERMIQRYLLFKDVKALTKRKYAVSVTELTCFSHGFRSAYEAFADDLTETEKETIDTMLDSLDFILKHMEIDYFSSRQAYNQFVQTISLMQRTLKKRPGLMEKAADVGLLFLPNGAIKPPEMLFHERNDMNRDILDNVLIRLFFSYEFDWKTIFQNDPVLYEHMTDLANEYCEDAVAYLLHIQKGEVFLNPEILQDNAAMIIKNMTLLNEMMEKHHMTRTSGSVMPLYYMS